MAAMGNVLPGSVGVSPAVSMGYAPQAGGTPARPCAITTLMRIAVYAVEDFSAPWYSLSMPELSRFLGIVIGIFPREHVPPHFHAVYGEYQITVEIQSGIVHGDFPKRALRHVLEWVDLHQSEGASGFSV